MSIEQFVLDIITLTIGVCIGSYVGAKVMKHTLKKEILEIVEEIQKKYDIIKIKDRATTILNDIETLIKHANKFLGVKKKCPKQKNQKK